MKKVFQTLIGMLVLSGGMLISGIDHAVAKPTQSQTLTLDQQIEAAMRTEVRF